MIKRNKIVLVTGASRGIGAATAIALAKKDYFVCVNYRTQKKSADQVVAKIHQQGGDAIAFQADVSNEKDVKQLFQSIDSSVGTLTHLVNNAGVLLPQQPLHKMNAARINKVLSNNVTSYFLCCKEAINRMSAGDSIVNVSSVASKYGSPNEYIDYAASKGAIDTLTIGLSVELGNKNIRVNGVRPGFIDTQMHADGGEPNRIRRVKNSIPLNRGGTVDEVAAAIVFLLSEKSSYVSGTFIDVAGGR